LSKLYLHVGHGKTGSSFLQSVFAKNATLLRANNIIYPGNEQVLESAASGETTSGNVGVLLEKLKEDNPFPEGPHSFLFSWEGLASKFREDEFVDACARAAKVGGKTVSVLFFIRDPIDLQLSSYTQIAQARKFDHDPEDYFRGQAKARQFQTFNDVQCVCTACKANDFELKIYNYTRSKSELINNTQSFLGLDDSVELELPSRKVNRSIGAMELGICRAMRESFSLFQTPKNENYLKQFIDSTPNVKWPPLNVSQESQDIFSSEVEDAMIETNTYLEPDAKYQLKHSKKTSDISDPTEEYGFILGTEIVNSTLKIIAQNLRSEDKITVLDQIFSSLSPHSQDLSEIRQYAYWLLAEEAFEKAIPILQQLVALDPRAAHYFTLARAYNRIDQLEKSIESSQLAFETDPTLDANVIFLVDRLLVNRRKPEARNVLESAKSHELKPDTVHYIAYRVAMADRDTDRAMHEITAAVACDPDSKRYKLALEHLTTTQKKISKTRNWFLKQIQQ
jgi:tetratricopeptide (TPR) repeat protein